MNSGLLRAGLNCGGSVMNINGLSVVPRFTSNSCPIVVWAGFGILVPSLFFIEQSKSDDDPDGRRLCTCVTK